MKNFHKIIKEICEEEQITLKILSKEWICSLEKNRKTKYIVGYKFDLNSQGIGLILDDKYALYEVLQEKGYPIITHHIIFKEKAQEKLTELLKKYGQNVVLKSNTGTCGNEVFHIENLENLLQTAEELFQRHLSLSLCPFYTIKAEYRVIVLDNKAKIIYGKRKPVVVGDGKTSIRELLEKENPYFFKQKKIEEPLKRILQEGEKFEYSWKFNLSQGANLFEVTEVEKRNQLEELAISICQDLGLRFCSIDIIETVNGELLIMEANSGVMMDHFIEQYKDGYKVAKEIYKEAILKMFHQ